MAVAVVVLASSLVALALCAWDKRRAMRGGGRVRETTLLAWSLLGGSPGLLAGMVMLRHKVRKPGFLVRLLAVVLFQLGLALAWLRMGAA